MAKDPGMRVTSDAYFYRRFNKKKEKLPLTDLPGIFKEYALLSAKAYIDDDKDVTIATPAGWIKWKKEKVLEIPCEVAAGCVLIGGMGYELWEKKVDEKYIVAIVFRGTDFSEKNDWYSNLRWIRLNFYGRKKYEAKYFDQYHQARKLTPMLVELIKNKYGDTLAEIVTTGHSLGGGLAQQSSYSCNDIKKVFAFDPSPVTGFMDISLPDRDINKMGNNIARIYQKGEVLSYLRSFLQFFYTISTKDPEITEYELNFLSGGFIKRHNMQELAKILNEH